MSAFVVERAHIDLLVTVGIYGPREGWSVPGTALRWFDAPLPEEPGGPEWLREHHQCLSHESADRVGQMLIAENVASVAYRYSPAGRAAIYGEGFTSDLDLPGPVDQYYLEPYAFRPLGAGAHLNGLAVGYVKPTAVEALKAIRCYQYQSSEHPGWDSSEASLFCGALTAALVCCLPGYQEAPWEWDDATVEQARARGLGFGTRPASGDGDG